VAGDVRRGRLAANGLLWPFLWRGLLQSHLGNLRRLQELHAAPGRGLRITCLGDRFSLRTGRVARPVERQIEFGQARHRELDGLPALQDRLDQPRAQKGEVNEAPVSAA
jgi:hypothetical protein